MNLRPTLIATTNNVMKAVTSEMNHETDYGIWILAIYGICILFDTYFCICLRET